MFVFFLFIFGLFIGSFLNVFIDRLPREESVVKGRSYCEKCKHKLTWYDLVPLFSFAMLKGKCRYCHVSLSFYYPIVELVTGILFVVAFLFLPRESIMYYLYLISSLIVIFFIDLKFGIIPDKVLIPAIVASFLFQLYAIRYTLYANLLSALGAFTFFFLLHVLTRGRGMGFGDVKYVVLMGLVLGFPNIIVGLYIAFLTGAVVSLMLVLWGKKKFKGSTIPFGPFLVLGTVAGLFWGDVLTHYGLLFLTR